MKVNFDKIDEIIIEDLDGNKTNYTIEAISKMRFYGSKTLTLKLKKV